jgi:hypothetical protein
VHARAADDVKSWKNACNQEKDNAEKLSKVLRDTEVQYAQALALNRDMGEALTPMLDMLVPVDAAVDPPPGLLVRTQQLPGKIEEYLSRSIRETVEQVLASVQAFHPEKDLKPVGKAMSDECSQEEHQALSKKLAPIAAEYVKSIATVEEDSQ